MRYKYLPCIKWLVILFVPGYTAGLACFDPVSLGLQTKLPAALSSVPHPGGQPEKRQMKRTQWIRLQSNLSKAVTRGKQIGYLKRYDRIWSQLYFFRKNEVLNLNYFFT